MAEFTPQPSCADAKQPSSLSVQAASRRITKLISAIEATEKILLRAALGRVLHQTIIADINVPSHNNSAMDGYAVHACDITGNTFSLNQIGAAFAGRPYAGKVNNGECIRIMTGAMMPIDCDTVIMQEHVKVNNNTITIYGQHQAGQNVRYAGEDLAVGATVLTEGHLISAADLGLLASLGMAQVQVKTKPKIAFFSTGDELKSIGETLEIGQIYDSNRYTLYGMLKRMDADFIDMGVVADNKPALRAALQLACAQADVVITTGGVSVGDADYVKDILAELGQVDFWKLAMKPGRPLAVGKINNALFFGLPGNPVSVMVTFYQFIKPALQQLGGQSPTLTPTMQANCVSTICKKPGRFEYKRGILFENNQGLAQVKITGDQGSGILHSMSIANCFILLEQQCDGVTPNTMVTVQPFSGLI